ncbi:hypothetical protein LUZ62_026734 [Rhynchospora pubera]|uniref:Transmembrane protein n=1 Tax=Rhynchospora pubera TaxID=906938 RepID=A0AAV8H8M3_9POAL|nr:hypothetical protein LUZ62_026734 [Rhynchospora pubera]
MDSMNSGEGSENPMWAVWNPALLFVVRPLLAVSFVFSFIALSWFVAWKTVLVHVPVVQEIFGLRKKKFKPKPPTTGRISDFYRSQSASSMKSGAKSQ